MAKNRFNFTINLDLGRESPPVKSSSEPSGLIRELRGMKKQVARLSQKKAASNPTRTGNSSTLVRELKALREDMTSLAKKARRPGNGNQSMLVSELKGLRRDIGALPHVAHSGGG